MPVSPSPYIVKPGHWSDESEVQLRVVLGEGDLTIIFHQCRDREEACGLGEAILLLGADDADELVGSALSDGEGVLPLSLGVSNKERPIWCISQPINHILPAMERHKYHNRG